MPTSMINDLNIYYEVHGEGVPLLLVAGLASDSRSWQPVLADLSAHFQVIIMDNRGVGRTTPQDTGISIAKMTDDCIGLAKHLGISSFHLLGHSMGGLAAMDCAIRYPQYVDKLILAATSSYISKRNRILFSDCASYLDAGLDLKYWFRNFFFWIFTPSFFEDEAALNAGIRFALEDPYPQSKTAFKNQVRAIIDFKGNWNLSKITSPALVIGGKEDLLFPSEITAKFAESIPTAQYILIEKAAHSIHMEQPRLFSKSVLDFLLKD